MANEPRCINCLWADKGGCNKYVPHCPHYYSLLEPDIDDFIEERRESFRAEWSKYAREWLDELFY